MGVLSDLIGAGGGSPAKVVSGILKNRKEAKQDKKRTIDEAEAEPSSFKRGGKVRKSGVARVHKGERVLTAKQDKKRRKARSKSR